MNKIVFKYWTALNNSLTINVYTIVYMMLLLQAAENRKTANLKEHVALDQTCWSVKSICNPFL